MRASSVLPNAKSPPSVWSRLPRRTRASRGHKGDGGAVRRVALPLVAVEVRPVADDVRDVPGVDVREALPCVERAGGRGPLPHRPRSDAPRCPLRGGPRPPGGAAPVPR